MSPLAVIATFLNTTTLGYVPFSRLLGARHWAQVLWPDYREAPGEINVRGFISIESTKSMG